MPDIERLAVPVARPVADGNIRPLYLIESAPRIWHPDCPGAGPVALLFRNEFVLEAAREAVIHVTADERWELSLDGGVFSMGPDRCDAGHWSFHSYRLQLAPGRHRLEALVWRAGDHAPTAQVTTGGGFQLAVEGAEGLGLATGSPGWRVRRVAGWSFEKAAVPPHMVGASHIIDGAAFYASGREAEFVPARVTGEPIKANEVGLMRSGRRLYPSGLPEQLRRVARAGRVRAVIDGVLPPDRPVSQEETARPAQEWQKLLAGGAPVTVPARTEVSVLVDLDDYWCAYPVARLSGGAGSEVAVAWAESLFEPAPPGKRPTGKGHRDEVAGKVFCGIRDAFRPDGGASREFRPCWWRAGRYLLISVRTAEEPLVIDDLHLLECRYPLENEGRFASDDGGVEDIVPVLVRGMQMCAHETYMDCPYYEQLMYVGDTRLEMLTTYVMTQDDRLPRRGIELFDWSRGRWEMVAEHYPSRSPQLSPTFSLLWISLVRDFALWRDRPEWLRERLPGVRAVLEQFRALRGPSGLLERLPGWPFVDWVPSWRYGNAPSGVEGVSAANNLFFVQALRDAAEVEDAIGEPLMAERCRALARDLAGLVVDRFWVPERKLLADDDSRTRFSEHAQCLALLNDVLDGGRSAACLTALGEAPDLARASIYFSFYLLEVFRKFGRGDLVLGKLGFWRELAAKGMKTPLECPEPARSDCHAWGSHPLFHLHASLCGVRPAAAGFRKVAIAPAPGNLARLTSRLPHPRGWVETELEFDGAAGTCRARVKLPPETPGVLRWRGREAPLAAGRESRAEL
jgi:hypothetical protein